MKSKFLFGVVALVVVLALAPTGFAQVNIQVSVPVSNAEVATARNAQAADPTSPGAGMTISGAIFANAPMTTTSLYIDYPGAVTSSGTCVNRSGTDLLTLTGSSCPNIPAADPLRIEGATGIFTGATISSINYGNGVIEITLPGGITAGVGTNTSGSFRLLGVRIDANGLTAPVAAAISLSNTANNYNLTNNAVNVINALTAAIEAPFIGTRSTSTASVGTGMVIFTNRNVPTGTNGASFSIKEGFASAWRTALQNGTNTNDPSRVTANSGQIRLTFSGITSGITLTLALSTGGDVVAALSGTSISTASGGTLTRTISFTGTSLSDQETIQVNVTPTVTATGSAFTAGTIQVTATFFPLGAALGDTKQPLATTYPSFAQADLGPLTIGTIINPTTTMLIPYVVSDLGFDTGIAVANTTADPFGGASNGGATAAGGALTISLYGRTATGATPTVVSLTTSATVRPGSGLDSSGVLASGSTWTALLSELRTAAGQTGSFTGYMFISVPFLNAHGASFVSDFRSFTSASPVLVVPPPNAANNRSTPAGSVETLGN